MTGADEIREAWRRMVPWGQLVSQRYELVDGHLVAAGEPLMSYAPINRPEIPAELAKVHSADDALAFARRYGELGFTTAHRDAPPGYDEVASPAAWQALVQERQQARQAPGDPLDWFIAHAATVRTIAEIAHLLSNGDEPPLARYLDQFRVQQPDEALVLRAARGGWRRPLLLEIPENALTPVLARRIITELLNPNLGRACRTVDRETLDNRFGLMSLLDVVYWLLADAVTGGQIRQCLACGSVFTATSDRQKFCPRPMGEEGLPSKCMNRTKVRRKREKERQGARKRQQRRARR